MPKFVSMEWALKRLLRSKANFDVLEGFLSELMDTDVEILEILESESNRDDEDDKQNRVDLKAKVAGGEIVVIEGVNDGSSFQLTPAQNQRLGVDDASLVFPRYYLLEFMRERALRDEEQTAREMVEIAGREGLAAATGLTLDEVRRLRRE